MNGKCTKERMRLRPALELLSLLFAIAAVLALSAFAVVEDSFFLRSDLRSLFVVVMAVGAVFLVPLAAGFGVLLALAPRLRGRAGTLAALALAALVTADFFYFFIAGLDKEFRILGLFRKLDAEYLFVVLWAVLVIGAWFLIARSAMGGAIARRTRTLALAGVPLALALLAGHFIAARVDGAAAGPTAGPAPRHVALVVLDGWPAQYGRAFNPAARARPGDGVYDKGRVFRNFRTSAAWTHGFFGTLYAGSPRYSFVGPGPIQRLFEELGGGDNLLAALQGAGVRTRVVAFHRNGFPEGSAAKISNYRALRSVFLTPRHAPIAEALALEYNLIIPGAPAETIWGDQRKRFVRRLLGLGGDAPEYDNILTGLLLPELRRIRRGARRSFLVFHTGWSLGKYDLPEMWDENLPSGDVGEVMRRTEGRDYRYDGEDEWYAERVRQRTNLITAAVDAKIGRFLEEMEAAGLLDDTLLIFTADHGSMYARGRFAYGFHPDEEVLRVPLAVFGDGRAGVDTRNFTTIDLVQTVLAQFGAAATLDPRAQDIFAAGAKPFAASATMRSDLNREWFLALYKGDRKYLFNLHAEGDGAAAQQAVDGFAATTLVTGAAAIKAVAAELETALAEFGIGADRLHPRFAALGRRPPAGAAQ